MKLLIVITLGVFLILGINAFSHNDDLDLDTSNAISPESFGILDKITCKLCTEAMRPVAKEVNKGSSKNEIKKALDKACTIIPEKKLRKKCRAKIEKDGDKIAEEVAGNLTGGAICKILQFC